MTWLAILAMGLLAGTVGGLVGFGGSNILLPVLVLVFGPKDAVPVMGVAGTLGNLARVAVWWREVDWRAAGIYAATAVPAVVLGARLFLALDAPTVEAGLGIFMLAMVPIRRWFLARQMTIGLGGLAAAGAGIGFLTGLVASTGPISTPFFLAYGLVKGAFIATEALGSLAVYLVKSLVFGQAGVLGGENLLRGLLVGLTMMAGAWLAKGLLAHIDGRRYQLLLDATMLMAGAAMIAGALWGPAPV